MSVIKKCNTCGREYKAEQDFLSGTSRWRMCERGNLWFNCGCNSTNMIIKGKFPWYNPEMGMSENAKSLFNQLPAIKKLPHLPTSIMELQQLICDENTSAKELADVAKKEPLIASNILKIANNLKASSGIVIESLEHAISYMGLQTLNDIVLTASISSFEFNTKIFEPSSFWKESFLSGQIAEYIARTYASHLIPDEVYLAGALCNLGKIAMAICLPEQADLIAKDCKDVKLLSSWRAGEQIHQTADHTTLGEIASIFWGLPEYVMLVSASHHKKAEPIPLTEVRVEDVIRLSNQMAHWVMLEPNKIEKTVLESAMAQFCLEQSALETLADNLMTLAA